MWRDRLAFFLFLSTFSACSTQIAVAGEVGGAGGVAGTISPHMLTRVLIVRKRSQVNLCSSTFMHVDCRHLLYLCKLIWMPLLLMTAAKCLGVFFSAQANEKNDVATCRCFSVVI